MTLLLIMDCLATTLIFQYVHVHAFIVNIRLVRTFNVKNDFKKKHGTIHVDAG